MSENPAVRTKNELWSHFKLGVATIAIGALYSTAMVIATRDNTELSTLAVSLLSILGTALVVLAFFLLKSYLKSVPAEALKQDTLSGTSDESAWDDFSIENRLITLETELSSIKLDSDFANLEKDELVFQVASRVMAEMKKEFEAAARTELQEKAATLRRNTILSKYKSATERLTNEVAAVRKAGTINLLIGSLIAIGGMTTLAIVVVGSPPAQLSILEYVVYFVPRVTLAFVIQLFAYFFLALYRKAHTEIKFLQNEITNLDLKYFALRAVIDYPEKPAYDAVIASLVATERNWILKKGETTAELEMAKIEKSNVTDVIKELGAALKSSKEKP